MKDVLKVLKRLVEEMRDDEEKVKALSSSIKMNTEIITNQIEDEGDIELCKSMYDENNMLDKEKKRLQGENKKRKKTIEEIIMEEGNFDKEQLTFGEIIEGF
jgi:hypothetical protein